MQIQVRAGKEQAELKKPSIGEWDVWSKWGFHEISCSYLCVLVAEASFLSTCSYFRPNLKKIEGSNTKRQDQRVWIMNCGFYQFAHLRNIGVSGLKSMTRFVHWVYSLHGKDLMYVHGNLRKTEINGFTWLQRYSKMVKGTKKRKETCNGGTRVMKFWGSLRNINWLILVGNV